MVNASLAFKAGRAAMYVRMSTENQQYSTENQADAIEGYASRQKLVIVKKFVDYGKSGLTLSGRAALRDLLLEVESGTAEFGVILVYDVSRWGRFQDADESAYYEYVCKRAHVLVHYCAEQFENDGSLSSTLLKTIKRSMAAEYSRELSVKVFAGQSRLVEMGYRQGGVAGFGLRRQLIGRDGVAKDVLKFGEHKNIQTDRVILIPGPQEEVTIVQNIFDLFTVDRLSESTIAKILNERGVSTGRGLPWSTVSVQKLLTNPKYVGSNVYNRTSYKLNKKAVRNPATMWIRRDGAFEPIVPLETFIKAQEITESKRLRVSDDAMLDHLRRLWEREGKLSGVMIAKERAVPSVYALRSRFKTIIDAYGLIGYTTHRDHKYHGLKSGITQHHDDLCAGVKARLRSSGATVQDHGRKSSFIVNGQFTTRLVLSYCNETLHYGPRWSIRINRSQCPDVTIVARLRPGNSEILDYYLFPSLDQLARRQFISSENSCRLEVYRFDTLDFFLSLARRSQLVQNI